MVGCGVVQPASSINVLCVTCLLEKARGSKSLTAPHLIAQTSTTTNASIILRRSLHPLRLSAHFNTLKPLANSTPSAIRPHLHNFTEANAPLTDLIKKERPWGWRPKEEKGPRMPRSGQTPTLRRNNFAYGRQEGWRRRERPFFSGKNYGSTSANGFQTTNPRGDPRWIRGVGLRLATGSGNGMRLVPTTTPTNRNDRSTGAGKPTTNIGHQPHQLCHYPLHSSTFAYNPLQSSNASESSTIVRIPHNPSTTLYSPAQTVNRPGLATSSRMMILTT